jgi:hypothetical protein
MNQNSKKHHSNHTSSGLIGLLFFLFFILGYLFPDYWWATHHWGFTNTSTQIILLTLSLTSFVAHYYYTPLKNIIPFEVRSAKWISYFLIVFISILMGFLFYHFPMVQDFYGEAYKLNSHLGNTLTEIPPKATYHLFRFGLAPWDGQQTVLSIISYLTYYSQWTYLDVFIVFDSFFGALYIFTWLIFVNKRVKTIHWKLTLGIIGITTPILLNFFGHIEINAPVLWINLLWITLAINHAIDTPNKKPWILLLLLPIGLKLHPVALLFIPGLFILFTVNSSHLNGISWKKIFSFVLSPIFILGAIAYFFVFEDYNDQRQLQDTAMEFDRLFLPLISPPAPLDNYNMLSFNHIFDYFSEILLWSPTAFSLLIIILISYRKELDWNNLAIKITGTTLILFGALFFVVNPLLSMQMDWELFAFPAPVFMVMLVVLSTQLEKENLWNRAILPVLSIMILTIPLFTIHMNEKQLSNHLISLGKRIYHTYYEWSAQTIHNGLGLNWKNRNLQLEKKDQILKDLGPYAIIGNDKEYASLHFNEGKFIFHQEKNYEKSLPYLESAIEYDTANASIQYLLMQNYFVLKQYNQSYEVSKSLIRYNYPTEPDARLLVIEAAINAEQYNDALKYTSYYLKNWTQPEYILDVHQGLLKGESKEKLKGHFNKPVTP